MAGTGNRTIRAGLAGLVAALALGCEAEPMVGPEGGTLVSRDGRFSLEIPAGALSTEVELSVEQVECDLGEAAVGACYAGRPLGVTFQLPVEVAYEVDRDRVEDVALVTESSDGWRTLPDHNVDAELGVVFGSAIYLSEYGLIDKAPP